MANLDVSFCKKDQAGSQGHTVKWCLAWRPWQVGPHSTHSIPGAEPAQATDEAKREQTGLLIVPNWEEGDNPSASPSLSGLLPHPGWRVAGWMLSAGLGVEHKGGFALSSVKYKTITSQRTNSSRLEREQGEGDGEEQGGAWGQGIHRRFFRDL